MLVHDLDPHLRATLSATLVTGGRKASRQTFPTFRQTVLRRIRWRRCSHENGRFSSPNTRRSVFGVETNEGADDLSARLAAAIAPMVRSVGLSPDVVQEAVERDLSRRIARTTFDYLEREGVPVHSKSFLDLGAGLGQVSVEAASRGAWVVAVEPGETWCRIVSERLSAVGRGAAVADGTALPFVDAVFDLIVSIQVLEHVAEPDVLLSEAFRVLKPGGVFYLVCENYLGFIEPHYRVPGYRCCRSPSARCTCESAGDRRSSCVRRSRTRRCRVSCDP